MYINAFEIPKTDKGIVYFEGSPRPYRADCKGGIFKIGESDVLDNKLRMEILTFRTFPAELFNYEYQQWLEIFFIDKDNTVGHILFKTESINNFLELIRKLAIQNKAIGTCIVTAKTSKRSSEKGNYYAVEFESSDSNPERINELIEFVNQNQIYAARLASTFEGEETNQTKELPPAVEE